MEDYTIKIGVEFPLIEGFFPKWEKELKFTSTKNEVILYGAMIATELKEKFEQRTVNSFKVCCSKNNEVFEHFYQGNVSLNLSTLKFLTSYLSDLSI